MSSKINTVIFLFEMNAYVFVHVFRLPHDLVSVTRPQIAKRSSSRPGAWSATKRKLTRASGCIIEYLGARGPTHRTGQKQYFFIVEFFPFFLIFGFWFTVLILSFFCEFSQFLPFFIVSGFLGSKCALMIINLFFIEGYINFNCRNSSRTPIKFSK